MPIDALLAPSSLCAKYCTGSRRHNGGSESLFWGHAVPSNTRPQRTRIQFKSFGPLRDCQCLSVVGNRSITAAITRLCFPCRPSNITSLVVTVIVDTIERVTIWARSENSQKSFKCAQFFRHSNASSAIIRIFRICWSQASSQHLLPRNVFRNYFTVWLSNTYAHSPILQVICAD